MKTQTSLFKEIWKDIPQYEGIYQASNYGNIRTVVDSLGNQFEYVLF